MDDLIQTMKKQAADYQDTSVALSAIETEYKLKVEKFKSEPSLGAVDAQAVLDLFKVSDSETSCEHLDQLPEDDLHWNRIKDSGTYTEAFLADEVEKEEKACSLVRMQLRRARDSTEGWREELDKLEGGR